MLCLRICQAALVYVNVLMIQDILDDPGNPLELGAEDERGLTPLFSSHVLPYGEVKLNMNSSLAARRIACGTPGPTPSSY
ncbi:hypothetical protein NRB56_61380 [Nocardia sp. RB56]|uniref:Tn3 transposase DDE domain-containing protein n=1 Tax=Nocardia aurantia TaxID=2585199 RepID=A0A7K0DXM0_9NOCA|nr:hypothetical protein [Nocardia aurantia]